MRTKGKTIRKAGRVIKLSAGILLSFGVPGCFDSIGITKALTSIIIITVGCIK